MRFSLHEHPSGVSIVRGHAVVYDVDRNVAHTGPCEVTGPSLEWRLGGASDGATLAVDVDLDPVHDWIVRCNRVDFPPGAVAYRHEHPGPGIRRLLHGMLRIERADGLVHDVEPGAAWFEGIADPVTATAAPELETAFVRVLLLPVEWTGRRTIRYLDPADEEKPKLQRPTIFLEHPLEPA